MNLSKTLSGPYRTADDLFLNDGVVPVALVRDIDPPGPTNDNVENVFYFRAEITVENCGNVDLTNVVVTDSFSNEAQPFSVSGPGTVVISPAPDPNNGMVKETVTWTVGTIPDGQSRTLTINVGSEFNPSGRLEPTSANQTIFFNGQDGNTGSASVTTGNGLQASVGAMAVTFGPEISCVGSDGEWELLLTQAGPNVRPHDKCAAMITNLPITLTDTAP